MKKIALAFAALAITAGSAFAENPNFGIPAELQQNSSAAQPIDRSTTASVNNGQAHNGAAHHVNPAANRYGDAQPRN
ncbi:hypothetical protein IFT84_03370 [Rhizobium sp. CFBP 8762]|uniref:hypothetical protein n=1 Tax=Rhizobium sp. CFBP 8762 TaxID=2775279 RepID=UPI00177FBBC5|nr:hypothetical protein [Rhizobium sp. CFBP 8762]MBD8553555.1 hypothetical protein [Rhizobium sp. CFBP 8762]